MNINDYVWVRLNEHGWAVFDGYHERLGLDPAHYRAHVETSGDWQRFQLWELMHIFGEQSRNGLGAMFDRNEVLTEAPHLAATRDRLQPFIPPDLNALLGIAADLHDALPGWKVQLDAVQAVVAESQTDDRRWMIYIERSDLADHWHWSVTTHHPTYYRHGQGDAPTAEQACTAATAIAHRLAPA